MGDAPILAGRRVPAAGDWRVGNILASGAIGGAAPAGGLVTPHVAKGERKAPWKRGRRTISKWGSWAGRSIPGGYVRARGGAACREDGRGGIVSKLTAVHVAQPYAVVMPQIPTPSPSGYPADRCILSPLSRSPGAVAGGNTTHRTPGRTETEKSPRGSRHQDARYRIPTVQRQHPYKPGPAYGAGVATRSAIMGLYRQGAPYPTEGESGPPRQARIRKYIRR